MKKITLSLALFTFIAFGCKKDETEPIPEPTPTPTPVVGPITLGCSYNNGLTLTNHNKIGTGVDYIINCDCEITGGKLAIDTNVIIQFSTNGSLKIKDNGYIEAKGTSTKTIVFEGQTNSPASWRGIFIESNNPLNSMDYCVIRNGGNQDNVGYIGTSSYNTKANIWVSGNFKLSNSTVTGSGGDGIYMYEEATLLTFSNNIVSNNVKAPIIMYAGDMANLGVATSTFIGNADNYIGIYSTSSNKEVAEATTFNKATIPYMLLNSHYFQNNLTVNPGVTIHSKAAKTLGLDGTGFIKMIGTATEPITLTGESNIAGFWNGIFIATTNPLNEINFCNISGGGNSIAYYQLPNASKGNIAVGWNFGNGVLKIGSNTTSTNSSGCVLAKVNSSSSIITNNSSLILTLPCTY
jgi:hypothetical protein